METQTREILHIIIGRLIYIHPSLCVLNFMLPAHSPKFAQVSCITQKTEQAAVSDLPCARPSARKLAYVYDIIQHCVVRQPRVKDVRA